jgi:hypothetical protein
MMEAVQLMEEKGLLHEDNGAKVCDLSVSPSPSGFTCDEDTR